MSYMHYLFATPPAGAVDPLADSVDVAYGPFTYDVWRAMVLAFVYEPGVDGKESAFRRGIVAAVSKAWRTALYGAPGFWSRISVDKRMPLSALTFALSKCTEGDLHLRFSLLNVRRLAGLPATPVNIDSWVDSVFDELVPLASRWKSFELDTENPIIFTRIRHHCVDLAAFSLARFDLSYTYLPGYSVLPYPADDRLPFRPSSWFQSVLPSLVHLSVYCVPLLLNNDLLFEGLEFVDLACYDCPASIPIDLLPRLFAVATRLRSLRLGTLSPFSLPEHYVLCSQSLRSLDINFDSGPITEAIIDALECPSLNELVVREVRDCVHYLTAYPVVLNRITSFRAHGDIGDRISLQHLFAVLPRLESLDLVHSNPDVFRTYCEWIRLRIKFDQGLWLHSLRTLVLPAADLAAVVRLVNLVGESIFPEVGRIGIERLRVERPADLNAEWNSAQWLRKVVPDFAFTDVYSPPVYLDPDGDYSSLVDLSTYPKDVPPYPAVADWSRPYLWEDIAHILFPAIARDASFDFNALIEIRGRLMLTSRWGRYKVCDIPDFWTRLIVSPRAHLDVVREWLEMTDTLSPPPLTITFRATRGDTVSPYFPNNNLTYWVDTAASILASQLDRCVSLAIVADNPELLTDIMFLVEGTRPALLKKLDVMFGIADYSHVRPHVLHNFAFLDLPPIGSPFRPFTSLSWIAGAGSNPSVTYTTSEIASCSIVHPSAQLVYWMVVICVLTSSNLIDTLLLDGLPFNYHPGTLTCSPPMHALVRLDVAFRGSDNMAQLVTRLNAPSLKVLRVTVTSPRDVQCLCACPGLLATIEDLVLTGSCAAGNEFYAIYSLLHRTTLIDLRSASNIFFSALAVASRRPRPQLGPNWNACPFLKHLVLSQVSLRDVQALLLMRLSKGYDMVESVCIAEVAGGEDATISAWFAAHDVHLTICVILLFPFLSVRFCLDSLLRRFMATAYFGVPPAAGWGELRLHRWCPERLLLGSQLRLVIWLFGVGVPSGTILVSCAYGDSVLGQSCCSLWSYPAAPFSDSTDGARERLLLGSQLRLPLISILALPPFRRVLWKSASFIKSRHLLASA
ncbi:hypothetical protein DFH06DRAFT_1140642 [Mycena polygramma]|nr:hypothetical protein DFH06DRAFT_1140642 [Mycena polygramma]